MTKTSDSIFATKILIGIQILALVLILFIHSIAQSWEGTPNEGYEMGLAYRMAIVAILDCIAYVIKKKSSIGFFFVTGATIVIIAALVFTANNA